MLSDGHDAPAIVVGLLDSLVACLFELAETEAPELVAMQVDDQVHQVAVFQVERRRAPLARLHGAIADSLESSVDVPKVAGEAAHDALVLDRVADVDRGDSHHPFVLSDHALAQGCDRGTQRHYDQLALGDGQPGSAAHGQRGRV